MDNIDKRKFSHQKWYNEKVRELFTKDELKSLMERNDWKGAWELFQTWGWIAIAFAMAGVYPSPLTIIPALFILGGKQLACAIIMHDTAHLSLFRSKKLNTIVGACLGAWPIWQDMKRYRSYHLEHHLYTGTDVDPDLGLARGFPASRASMTRKISRDLLGMTGLKGQVGAWAMHLGFLKYELGGRIIREGKSGVPFGKRLLKALGRISGPLLSNLVLFGILWLCGAAWLYLLWIGALLTTYNFSIRIRAIAEHSVVPDRNNPHTNTRTIYANFLEKMLFAPLHVNYHAEHHLLMGAPSYNYPRMHKLLKARGYYNQGVLARGYGQVLKLAIKRKKL